MCASVFADIHKQSLAKLPRKFYQRVGSADQHMFKAPQLLWDLFGEIPQSGLS